MTKTRIQNKKLDGFRSKRKAKYYPNTTKRVLSWLGGVLVLTLSCFGILVVAYLLG